ncbi:MAG: ATP-binding protein [Chlamydiae bacterium]|nr:ATP-binding protein [Chlamydiota bacterium]MBI3277038.1 ATP-binding protein [Chlamydiota bacterium]
MLKRILYHHIWEDLSKDKSMIFLAGPRQSGKTTFARMLAKDFSSSVYFNWDLITNKSLLIQKPTFFEEVHRKDNTPPLVIYDEIHKYRKWKNYLKGIYDQFSNQYQFLVLGSGRLNVFQKGGDSLAGRYFLLTLWPFTLAELAGKRRSFNDFFKDPLMLDDDDPALLKIWENLSRLSGFPEPYLSGRETVHRRWSKNYGQQLIREDIRNMTSLKNMDDVEILFSLLPSKVGSPLSLSNLAQDLQVSFNSVRDWLKVFESFFIAFRISPWSNKISRAIKKEKKLYLFDVVNIPSDSAKFENRIALELLRAVSNWNDLGLGNFDLHYLRNKEGEEVDFLIANNHVPQILVEAKLSETGVSKSLLKFQSHLNIPALQLVNRPNIARKISNQKQQILIVTASRWLATLP